MSAPRHERFSALITDRSNRSYLMLTLDEDALLYGSIRIMSRNSFRSREVPTAVRSRIAGTALR